MSQITAIPLSDQIVAVLRVRRLKSFSWCDSEEIALQLDRGRTEIVMALHGLCELGLVSRLSDSVSSRYRVAPDSERTPGCCCCCDARLLPTDTIFCQTCGPEFSGRV